jgi:hypothetical protein
LAATGALLLTHYYHLSTIMTSVLTVAVQAGLFIPSLILCWRMLLRPPAFLPKCWHALFRNRLGAVLMLVVFSLVLTLSGKAVLTLLFGGARHENLGQLIVAQQATMIASSAVFELFIVITFVILARRRLGLGAPRQTA